MIRCRSVPYRGASGRDRSRLPTPTPFVGPATTQNLVVKFDGEICGGVSVEMLLTIFPSKRSPKISFQTLPEVRHQFRQKLRQLHSGNHWCLLLPSHRKCCDPDDLAQSPKMGSSRKLVGGGTGAGETGDAGTSAGRLCLMGKQGQKHLAGICASNSASTSSFATTVPAPRPVLF